MSVKYRYPKGTLENLREKYNDICQICGKEIVYKSRITIDHIQPQSKGGTDEFNNLQPAHEKCNWKKSNKWI